MKNNTSSKLKRRSHRIAPKLEFSNTRDDPIEIEEAEDEGSVQREKIDFIEDESKKQDGLETSGGGYSSNDLSEFEEGYFSTGQGSIWLTPPALSPPIPPVSTLPFLNSFFFINFQVPYLFLSQVSPWSTLHLKARAFPSLDLSFLDQATSHIEPPSKPPTEPDVVVARSIISHMLSLDLLSLSTVKKKKKKKAF